MKRLLIALAFCLASIPAASMADTGAQAVDAGWRKAAIANDVEGLVKLYAKDAVAWLPGFPEAHGTDAIRGAYQAFLGANTIKDFVISNATYRNHGASRSVGWGHFTLTLQPKAAGSGPVVMNGRFTVVAEKQGKNWVYVVDHASADPEPPKK